MMISSLLFVAAATAARICTNITVPVDVSARNGVFDNIPVPTDNIGATQFVQNLTRQGANFSANALSGYATRTGRYNISAQYCKPSNAVATTRLNLQILTHGIGFDKTYWDIPFNGFNYSYINTAVNEYGYATFSYDRLGIGNSSHGEPKNEIQAPLEVAALAAITNQLRNGTIPGISDRFDKIIHVGHSFGSIQSYTLTAMYPGISDGIVLTGYSINSSFISLFAAGGDLAQAYLNQPLRFGNATAAMTLNNFLNTFGLNDLVRPVDVTALRPLAYPAGYLTPSNNGANQYQFFAPPYFDPAILYFSENTKQPVTLGELLTVGGAPMKSTFNRPVLVVTGQFDLPFCGGDCFATGGTMASIPAGVKMSVPNASNFLSYVQPNAGHGINAHYNATGAYRVINNYLRSQGL